MTKARRANHKLQTTNYKQIPNVQNPMTKLGFRGRKRGSEEEKIE
jgi:hypothetical protein